MTALIERDPVSKTAYVAREEKRKTASDTLARREG
jgi:hypothetical protein